MRATLTEALRFVEVALPEPGSRFGAYVIERPVGAGGMAVVWKAQQTALGRFVALKIMRDETARDDPEAVPRFMREARVAASLTHPGIVQVYDVGSVDGRPYIAMEWIEGRTLAALMIARGGQEPLPRAEKIALLTDIAEILAHAHARGVVHRDVKPANVMVDLRGRPRLVDFGIAKRFIQTNTFETKEDVILGTPAYMGPEADLIPKVDARFDQYAWGVIAYELLAGRRPPAARLDDEPEIEAVLVQAIARDPDERFPSMDRLLVDWRAATAPPALRSPLPPPLPAISAPPARAPAPHAAMPTRSALLFVLSATTVASLALAIFLLLERRRSPPPPLPPPVETPAGVTPVERASASASATEPAASASDTPPTAASSAPLPLLPIAKGAIEVSAATSGEVQRAWRPVHEQTAIVASRCFAGVAMRRSSRAWIVFMITADGTLREVEVTARGGLPPSVVSCIRAGLRATTLGPAPGAGKSRYDGIFAPR